MSLVASPSRFALGLRELDSFPRHIDLPDQDSVFENSRNVFSFPGLEPEETLFPKTTA